MRIVTEVDMKQSTDQKAIHPRVKDLELSVKNVLLGSGQELEVEMFGGESVFTTCCTIRSSTLMQRSEGNLPMNSKRQLVHYQYIATSVYAMGLMPGSRDQHETIEEAFLN